MVNDIKPIDKNNELLKFADDKTLEVPGINGSDTSNMEVNNIVKWSELNRLPLNMNKTWEMVIQGNGNGSIHWMKNRICTFALCKPVANIDFV